MIRTYRLGDLTRVLHGRVPANTVPDPDGPRFFGIAEISARGRSAPRYVEHGSNVKDAVILVEGDVVVALLGNIGDATLVDAVNAGAVLGRECAALRVTSLDVLRPAWLCAWVSSEEFRSQVAQNTSGTTMPRLSTKALDKFTVTVPVVDKQVEVAELVRRFDNAIGATATTLQQLQDLRVAELQLAMANSEQSS
jgi:Type I restriction modification DNA specificity domain